MLSLAGVAAPAHAAPVVIQGADPDSYSLDLRYLTAGSGKLTGGERIEFVNRGPGALDRVWLRLWANGPDRCRPRAIDVHVEAPARAGAERERCSALEVLLPAPVAPGARSSISLRFTVRVRHKDDRFGHAGHISLLGNVIPVLAVQDDRGLHLEPYSGSGESFYSLGARWTPRSSCPRTCMPRPPGRPCPTRFTRASGRCASAPSRRATSHSPSAGCEWRARPSTASASGRSGELDRASCEPACAQLAGPSRTTCTGWRPSAAASSTWCCWAAASAASAAWSTPS